VAPFSGGLVTMLVAFFSTDAGSVTTCGDP